MNKILAVFILLVFIFSIFYFIHNLLKSNNIVFIENFDNNTIPKIIIQTWKTKLIPHKYKNDVKSCLMYNPDYEYKFFSDDDIDDFLEEFYPDWFETYNKLPIKIQKIDFFRYIAIYHFGGFYLDLDMTILKNFDDLLENECVFPVDQNIDCTTYNKERFTELCIKDNALKTIIGQYAFAAKKNNEFIKLLIDNIHKNINDIIEQYKVNNIDDNIDHKKNYIYSTTGPDYVTNCYIDYKADFENQNKIKILHNDIWQHFGDYAKHNFVGTWK
jgi:mannosyltransferase OCH1-like enzyme